METTLVQYLGPAAALGAALSWAVTSMFFASAGRRIGSTAVNSFRLFVAVGLLACAYWLRTGDVLPAFTQEQVLYLAVSGIIGFTICDQALFTSLVYIGPRRATLLMTCSPIFAFVFGLIGLRESLSVFSLIGAAITLGGVWWVITERTSKPGDVAVPDDHSARRFRLGVMLALVGAVTQALGAVFSKKGMPGGGDAVTIALGATLVRATFGALGTVPIVVFERARSRRGRRAGLHGSVPIGYLLAVFGAFCGPFLGVWLFHIGLHETKVAVAQTLAQLSPVLVLPLVVFVYKEKVSLRGFVGACVAVFGAAVLVFATTDEPGDHQGSSTGVHAPSRLAAGVPSGAPAANQIVPAVGHATAE